MVEVYKDNAGEWRWRKTAANGEIVEASSEGFENRSYALEQAKKKLDAGEILVDEVDDDE